MKVKFAIIGGGVAGLCAAIRLTELGEEPVLIEGGSYPAHKVCGEFISPESIDYLHQWNIRPVPIYQAFFRNTRSTVTFSFPSPAGGLSHFRLDPGLAQRALASGTHLLLNTQVKAFYPKKSSKDNHLIHLSTGETLEASHVIIATGRIPSYSLQPPAMSYLGFKMHFSDIANAEQLVMFSLPGAYLGIAPVENDLVNVAGLADLKKMGDTAPHAFIEHLISQNAHLHFHLSQGKKAFDEWMITYIPEFGIKQTPDWIDTYFIGDAAMTIPPASGSGLSLAVLGGKLVAEYAVRHQFKSFKGMWIQRCSSQLFWAKLLHRLMINPFYSHLTLRLAQYFPYISRKMFQLTRQSVR